MLIKIGKGHVVFISRLNDVLWRERWFSVFPWRWNETYDVNMTRRLIPNFKGGILPGESIFPPHFRKRRKVNEDG